LFQINQESIPHHRLKAELKQKQVIVSNKKTATYSGGFFILIIIYPMWQSWRWTE
jgi:hypothetical protein